MNPQITYETPEEDNPYEPKPVIDSKQIDKRTADSVTPTPSLFSEQETPLTNAVYSILFLLVAGCFILLTGGCLILCWKFFVWASNF